MGLFISTLSLIACFLAARRSLGHGLSALLAVGYAYGIVRANFPDGYSHFAFDAALLGLYVAEFTRPLPTAVRRASLPVVPWLCLLVGWPLVIFLVPYQHPLIQLVGLRGAIYFLPVILLGSRLGAADLDRLTRTILALNCGAFLIGIAEYLLGLGAFYPRNAVTELVWLSKDVADHTAHRIPATFVNSHAYGGTMLATLPFLLNRWQEPSLPPRERGLAAVGVLASTLGIFMCAARVPVVQLLMLALLFVLTLRLPSSRKATFVLFALVVAYFVGLSERLQRFTTLADPELVADRVHVSANMSFFTTLANYPLGAGLGSSVGTSLPFFLRELSEGQIGMENCFSHIALEQSPLGLLLWLSFVGWVLLRPDAPPTPTWRIGTRFARAFVFISWTTAWIGVGMLTAIPAAPLLLLQMGLLARNPSPSTAGPYAARRRQGWRPPRVAEGSPAP